MDLEVLRSHCLSKKGVTEEFPFDEVTLVFKVLGKMFCLTDINLGEAVNLKCDPERAIELRENFEEISPGYHMNKMHWNTVSLSGTLKDDFIIELINHSYDLVVSGLNKKLKEKLTRL